MESNRKGIGGEGAFLEICFYQILSDIEGESPSTSDYKPVAPGFYI